GRAAVDARDRLVEVVPLELLEDDLLDLRDLRLPVDADERRRRLRARQMTERHALELPLEVVARGRELREGVLPRLHVALRRLDLVLDRLDLVLRLRVDRLTLLAELLVRLDRSEDPVGRLLVVERVVVLEALLLELALHEAEVQVLRLV